MVFKELLVHLKFILRILVLMSLFSEVRRRFLHRVIVKFKVHFPRLHRSWLLLILLVADRALISIGEGC